MVHGQFLAAPAPQVALSEASPRYLDEKRAFEAARLAEWLP
jgi:hypothetical protein